jgi:hypothetical protein
MRLAVVCALIVFLAMCCAEAAPIARLAALEQGTVVRQVRTCTTTYQRSGLRRFFGQTYCVGK